jgi:nucleoporin GLE1
MAKVVDALRAGLQMQHPQVDVTDFLLDPPPNTADTKGPAMLIYLVNVFAKSLISQFIGETAVATSTADPIGIIASSIFAQNDFLWNGVSLVDILIAKYHVVCPVLFGINGNPATDEGRRRLGWLKQPDGQYVSEQRHAERMTGLGAGFAAFSLRNYDKSKLANPFPPYHFWRALADITNTPAKYVSSTHFLLLKAMIDGNEQRILELFGDAGLVALRRATVEFPRRVGSGSVAEQGLALLAKTMRKEKRLFL